MTTEERIKLTNGYRWYRWIFLVTGVIAFLGILDPTANLAVNITATVISAAAFYLLNRARRIYFDSRNIYFVYGKEEKIVPMRTVKSLKRSAGKLNGSRYWILIHEGDAAQEKKSRFFCGPFGAVIKDFKAYLKRNNSEVVIWDHPHFNH